MLHRWLISLFVAGASACYPEVEPTGQYLDNHGHSHDRYHSHNHGHSHGERQPQRQLSKPSDMPPDKPKNTAINGYSSCVFDMPRAGPGRHGGSINKDDPLTSYAARNGQTVQIASADDCADACFARPGCIGMNFYDKYDYCYLKFEMMPQAKNELGWDSCSMVHLSENGAVLDRPAKAPNGDPVFERELKRVQEETRLRRKQSWDRQWANPTKPNAAQPWSPNGPASQAVRDASPSSWTNPQPANPANPNWNQPQPPNPNWNNPRPVDPTWNPQTQTWDNQAQSLAEQAAAQQNNWNSNANWDNRARNVFD